MRETGGALEGPEQQRSCLHDRGRPSRAGDQHDPVDPRQPRRELEPRSQDDRVAPRARRDGLQSSSEGVSLQLPGGAPRACRPDSTKSMFNRLLNRFGKPFYSKEKEYRASYHVEVKNISKSNQTGYLIIPVVKGTPEQTLLVEPNFSPVADVKMEKIYGNSYAIWELALDPKEEKTFKQFFNIKVQPTTGTPGKFTMDDYKKLDPNVISPYLAANDYINSTSKEIIELAQTIRGKETNVLTIVNKINEFVIGYLTYGNPITGIYSAHDALEKKTVDCGGFDTLFVSLCQAVQIPARVVSGFWAGYHFNDMHAWAQVMLPDGSWLGVDPSTEHLARSGRTRKSGKLGFLGSDRVAFSVGCDLELKAGGETFATDILQNPIIYPENNKLEIKRIFSTQPL